MVAAMAIYDREIPNLIRIVDITALIHTNSVTCFKPHQHVLNVFIFCVCVFSIFCYACFGWSNKELL